jgi:SAM-dependent methyltransferase
MIRKHILSPTKKWFKKKVQNVYYELEAKKPKIKEPKKDNSKVIYLQYQDGEDYFLIPSEKDDYELCEQGLPIPPVDLWLGYGKEKEVYLYGKNQVKRMLEVLKDSEFELTDGKKVLDFGCGAGRMIRWFKPFAEKCEVWGTDISSDCIFWAKKYLRPPFNFATTTTIPHLPFEDFYFDLIYAGSVFTHIDDLAEAWLLELRRILKKDGRIFITIQDKHSIQLLKDHPDYKNEWLAGYINNNKIQEGIFTDFESVSGGRGLEAQIFYDTEYFCESIKGILKTVSVNKEIYGFQTGIVLKKN